MGNESRHLDGLGRQRYEHFLFRTGKGSFPSAVVTLAADVEWVGRAGAGSVQTPRLIRWAASILYRNSGEYVPAQAVSGESADELWLLLEITLRNHKNTWIIARGSRVLLDAVEVWNGIEEGRIVPTGTQGCAHADGEGALSGVSTAGGAATLGHVEQMGKGSLPEVRRGVDKHRGRRNRKTPRRPRRKAPVLILNDPPIVLQLQLRGVGGSLTWVDAANYGVESSVMGDESRGAADRLAAWFVRAASTLRSLGSCGWRATVGAQAMHVFRSVYLGTSILSHTSRYATALESDGLFGGRCECFQVGKIAGPVHVLDFRSMYPFICTHTKLPVRLVGTAQGVEAESLVKTGVDTAAIAQVVIECDLPFFPYRQGKNVIFPVGRYRTTLVGEELEHALLIGAVRSVEKAALYETDYALRGYMESVYALRESADAAGDKLLSAWTKRLLVALPGKFAQVDRYWKTRPGADPAMDWGEWWSPLASGELRRWRSIGGIVQTEEIGEYANAAVPAITAAVSAAARMRLLRAMLGAGLDNVYYCDTDSIVTNDAGRESLVQHGWLRWGELGFLRSEVTAADADIFGLKHYRIGDRYRFAGCPGGGAAFYSAGGPEPWTSWVGWSMRHGQRPGAFRVQRSHTPREGRYDRLRPAGGRIKPVEIWEED